MSTQVKRRRGTAAENASFTGAAGEIVAITDTKRIAVHDASTAGGATFLNVNDIQNKVAVGDGTVGGTGNAITLTNSFAISAYGSGLEIQFKATADNSGAVTINVDGKGVKNLEKMVAGTSTALATGDIKNGVIYVARYDGTRFQLQTGGATAIVSVKTQQFSASGTYTPSAGMVYCVVELVGGGGGGGGVTNGGNYIGGGGGAGGYSRETLTAATIGASQTVTIGAAGTAGNTSGSDGGAGGTTSLGALLQATGGAGGIGGAAAQSQSGGAGGAGSGGDMNSNGQGGGAGSYSATSNVGHSGAGGSSLLGGGGQGQKGNVTGVDGQNGGGGSGGTSNGVTNRAGGAGGAGYMIIREYCSQ